MSPRTKSLAATLLLASAVSLAAQDSAVLTTMKPFGKLKDGTEAHLYTIRNANGMLADITDYGATLVSLNAPGKDGKTTDVVLGFDDVSDYQTKSPYFGATIGRYANRIGSRGFTLDGKAYTPPLNSGPPDARCTLHGGDVGLDKVMWTAHSATIEGDPAVVLEYTSPDGDQGFPGKLWVQVIYRVTPNNSLRIDYRATTDKPTPVNLTNHSYFNLRGEGNGTILDHVLTIRSARITPVDPYLIPTGEFISVEGTPFDFNAPHSIGERINAENAQMRIGHGYDHNWVLDKPAGALEHVATLYEPESGRVMEVSTTEPGVQVYTGNFLNGLSGKSGHTYPARSAICLETQHYPDSPNRPEFPSTILQPGDTFASTTIYRFTTR